MGRRFGPILVLLLIAIAALVRIQGAQHAQVLLDHELQARQTLAALHAASLQELASGGAHPGLGALVHGVPGLRFLHNLTDADTSYARDGVYMYGLRTILFPGEDGVPPTHGFVLRAWPRHFGETGDLEYLVNETGTLFEGQNHMGRNGTQRGFPPDFPHEINLKQQRKPWWVTTLPEPPSGDDGQR